MSTYAALTLVGHVGQDGELKNLGTQNEPRYVLNFSIATQNRKDQATLWTRASVWGPRAQALAKYITKGSLVMVTGQPLPPKAFKRADNTFGSSLEMFANEVVLLPSATKSQADNDATFAANADVEAISI